MKKTDREYDNGYKPGDYRDDNPREIGKDAEKRKEAKSDENSTEPRRSGATPKLGQRPESGYKEIDKETKTDIKTGPGQENIKPDTN